MDERYLPRNRTLDLGHYPSWKLLEILISASRNLDGDTAFDIFNALEKKLSTIEHDDPDYDGYFSVFHETRSFLDKIGYSSHTEDLAEAS